MFQQIVCLDHTKLQAQALEELREFSREPLKVYDNSPETKEEIIQRIGKADAVLLSWNTPLERDVLEACPNIRYIGLCCTYYNEEASNVDVATAREKRIKLTAIKDYADEGVIEFILYHLIGLAKGWIGLRWKEEAVELGGKTLGIIGMGTLGLMLGKAAKAFGMEVVYYSRGRKEEASALGFRYLPLGELLAVSEVVSTHLPRNTRLLGQREFGLMRQGSIFINTSLGPTFAPDALLEWLKEEGNYAIIDKDGSTGHAAAFAAVPNIIGTQHAAGLSVEAMERLSEKVLENIRKYVEKHRDKTSE
jgi:lactate dehydrogenase-like 2-hydroxyacid dehydrogenase